MDERVREDCVAAIDVAKFSETEVETVEKVDVEERDVSSLEINRVDNVDKVDEGDAVVVAKVAVNKEEEEDKSEEDKEDESTVVNAAVEVDVVVVKADEVDFGKRDVVGAIDEIDETDETDVTTELEIASIDAKVAEVDIDEGLQVP